MYNPSEIQDLKSKKRKTKIILHDIRQGLIIFIRESLREWIGTQKKRRGGNETLRSVPGQEERALVGLEKPGEEGVA